MNQQNPVINEQHPLTNFPNQGLEAALRYPLFEAIFKRRSRRIIRGIKSLIEADLLLQNLLLAIQAMGLGGWIHAAFIGPLVLGDAEYAQYGSGLGFRYAKAKKTLRNLLFFTNPLPAWRDNPVGLDGVIEGFCPPYYDNMSDAIDALIKEKYGEGGIYRDPQYLGKILKPGTASKYLEELPHYSADVIACAKDICNYIYDTYGRFPAHVDAMYVPGVWAQAHNLDLDYYDQFYEGGYTDTQANHDRLWYGESAQKVP